MSKREWVWFLAVAVIGLAVMTYLFGGNIYRLFAMADEAGGGPSREQWQRYEEARLAPELSTETAKLVVERFMLRTSDVLVWKNPRFETEGDPAVFVVHGALRHALDSSVSRPVEFCTTRRPEGWVVWERDGVCDLRGAHAGQ